MKKAIEIKNIYKKYPNFTLGELNLNIPSGIIIGLIGENGAGKTTLIKCILNALRYDGTVQILGQDMTNNSQLVKEQIGTVLDNTFFPDIMTPKDIEKVMMALYTNWDCNLYQHYLEIFRLSNNQAIKSFSKGMQKKLEIAVALAHHPKLLILDEPTSGLDPVIRSEILDIFLEFMQEEDHTILFSTHITSDLEHIADYIVFMDKGNILLEKDKDELLDYYGILKCSEEEFKKIDKKDYVCYRKNKYSYEVLVIDRLALNKQNKNLVIDKATLEDIMVFYIKGVRK